MVAMMMVSVVMLTLFGLFVRRGVLPFSFEAERCWFIVVVRGVVVLRRRR